MRGVEQVELTSPLAALREAGAEIDLLAPEAVVAVSARAADLGVAPASSSTTTLRSWASKVAR
jgi:putative intracellular protease/amidase